MKSGVIIGVLVFIATIVISLILMQLGIPIFFAFLFLPLIELPIFSKKSDTDQSKFQFVEPKFCPKCGYELEGWENFCPRCGYKLR